VPSKREGEREKEETNNKEEWTHAHGRDLPHEQLHEIAEFPHDNESVPSRSKYWWWNRWDRQCRMLRQCTTGCPVFIELQHAGRCELYFTQPVPWFGAVPRPKPQQQQQQQRHHPTRTARTTSSMKEGTKEKREKEQRAAAAAAAAAAAVRTYMSHLTAYIQHSNVSS
jgi:hypothetical protein